ncbi:14110_t:CDS:1 [Acaulospora colombiana]|uniref:14110_t:CDS:1 n=1 Tax=Acaulospora colombiana TaxID=27376 RepID=A0ACA9L8Q7_9GLOM|nr:14110_t:CDS:1 [Acaulospora colombiana]
MKFANDSILVNKKPLTEEEIEKIYSLRILKKKWAEIARELGNKRTPNTIKNVWNQRLSKTSRGKEIDGKNEKFFAKMHANQFLNRDIEIFTGEHRDNIGAQSAFVSHSGEHLEKPKAEPVDHPEDRKFADSLDDIKLPPLDYSTRQSNIQLPSFSHVWNTFTTYQAPR